VGSLPRLDLALDESGFFRGIVCHSKLLAHAGLQVSPKVPGK
jgi:hypothetical protein